METTLKIQTKHSPQGECYCQPYWTIQLSLYSFNATKRNTNHTTRPNKPIYTRSELSTNTTTFHRNELIRFPLPYSKNMYHVYVEASFFCDQ